MSITGSTVGTGPCTASVSSSLTALLLSGTWDVLSSVGFLKSFRGTWLPMVLACVPQSDGEVVSRPLGESTPADGWPDSVFQRLVLGLRRNTGSECLLPVRPGVGFHRRACTLKEHICSVSAGPSTGIALFITFSIPQQAPPNCGMPTSTVAGLG